MKGGYGGGGWGCFTKEKGGTLLRAGVEGTFLNRTGEENPVEVKNWGRRSRDPQEDSPSLLSSNGKFRPCEGRRGRRRGPVVNPPSPTIKKKKKKGGAKKDHI